MIIKGRAILEEQLIKLRRQGEEREAQRRAAHMGLSYLDLTAAPVHVDALKLIPEEKARRLKVAPFEFKKQQLALAAVDPGDAGVRALAREFEAQGISLTVYVVSRASLEYAWKHYEFIQKPAGEISGKVEIKAGPTDFTGIEIAMREFLASTSAVGGVVDIVLAGALGMQASDVHFEPEEKSVLMRYRIDGLLHDVTKLITHQQYEAVVSRLKLLANLKINVHDEAQDGRFTIALGGAEIEIRLSVIPAEFGETIVMRVLDPRVIRLELKDLGLREDDRIIVEAQLRSPNGMLLNTGPTGSGKTTTLYSFLKTVQKPEIKIITIEDPIEYHLEGIEQTQVAADSGYDFGSGLKSIMRQDPDVILVGEIRDKETADTAIQAALTGHLVFSTVHANSAVGAIPRLIDLGARPASIGPALNLIIAQRLIRRLCSACKQKEPLDKDRETQLRHFLNSLPKRVNRAPYQELKVYQAAGCKECGGLGYRGRVAIFELLDVVPDLESLVEKSVGEAELQKFALAQGMITLQQDGLLKIFEGVTDFKEVERVTGPIKL